MSKFGSLAADVSAPFRVEIIDPVTDKPITDKDGNPAWIAVWSTDSPRAREFNKARRKDLQLRVMRSRTGRVEADDALESNIATCAALTDSWYLVDPATCEKIDVECTAENAAELYSEPGLFWLFVQPFSAAGDMANFMQRGSKP